MISSQFLEKAKVHKHVQMDMDTISFLKLDVYIISTS